MEQAGEPNLHFEIGRPDFDTPEYIKKACIDSITAGDVFYTSNFGILPLREAIANKLRTQNGIDCKASEIIVSVGLTEAVYDVLCSILDEGDEILVPDPVWINYMNVPKLLGAVPVSYHLREENDYQIDLDERLIYDGKKHISIASLPGMKERTVTLNGFSKAYSMTGWRLGYAAAPESLIAVLNKIHQHNTTCATSFVQQAAVAALRDEKDEVNGMVREYQRRRDYAVDAINRIKGISCLCPKGAFYIFINIKKLGRPSAEVAEYLLNEAKLAFVPGDVFGPEGEGYLRMSFANSYENIVEGCERLKNAVEKLSVSNPHPNSKM